MSGGKGYSFVRQLTGLFFSSRRRHTIYWRDWSSDVCSSDLAAGCGGDKVTGPVRPPDQSCPSAGVPLCEDPDRADVAREAVADLVGRVAPKLEKNRKSVG